MDMNNIVPTIVQGLEIVVTFLNNVPVEYYAVIIASLPFSVMVSFAKVFIKRHWDATPSETKMFLTNFGGIALMALAAYLQTTPETDPWVAVGSLVGVTTFIQQPFFFKVVKPFTVFTVRFISQWNKGNALNDELMSAAMPESGLPVETK